MCVILIPPSDCFVKIGLHHLEFRGGLYTKIIIYPTYEVNLALTAIHFASFISGIWITLLLIPFLIYSVL
jgi:hypothetical protein